MKNAISILLFAVVLMAASCSKDDDNNSSVSSQVATSVQSGTWRITSYVDNGNDETSDFSSFTFTFSSGGTLNVVGGAITASGTWATGIDDSKNKLVLFFASPALLAEISEDWEIISHSSAQVNLRHISGGSGETDLLVFQKN
jgi:hypothetical protein